jgi:hypothetical protein
MNEFQINDVVRVKPEKSPRYGGLLGTIVSIDPEGPLYVTFPRGRNGSSFPKGVPFFDDEIEIEL